MSANLLQGIAPDGTIRAIAVAQDGSLVTSGSSGGGAGGGDASSANQQVQTSLLEIIRDRLSSITTATDTLESLITSLNSYVDGLEGLLTSANTTGSAIAGFVDQLEGYTDGIEANQCTAIGLTTTIRDRLPPTLVNNRLVVDGSGVTQPISATTLPLPTGATTETTLALIPTRIGNTTDTIATTDTGTFSLVALLKRLLSIKLPSALSNDRLKTESALTTASRTTSFINTSAAGTIAAGANSIAIANIGSAAGTVKGVSFPAGASISFAANGNDVLDAVSYVATGTNFLITTVV